MKIISNSNIDANWLLKGTIGEMLTNSSKIENECKLCDEKDKHLKTKDKLILKLEQENETLKTEINEIKKHFGESVRDVGVAVAG